MGNSRIFIKDTDREWVHECFEWLIKTYGYPFSGFKPVLFTKEFFPVTLAGETVGIDGLLDDLCELFHIDRSIISSQIIDDIRDTYGTPFEIHGAHFECEVEFDRSNGGHYTFFIAQSTLKNHKRVLFYSVFRFIQIKLSLYDESWIDNEDHYFLFFLVGIYTGWGVILAQTMTDIGKSNDGLWELKWRYISPMPAPVMAYGLALHSAMREEKDPVWKKYLPAEMQTQFENAVEFIQQNPSPVVSRQELAARDLLKESFRFSDQKDFDSSIANCQKALFLTTDDNLKCTIYNKIGYTLLLKGEFQKAIADFQKALTLNSNATYAYDNLSFAFIMLGDTDTGKYYHALAANGERIRSYVYRNLAVYHQKRGEIDQARKNFRLAFEHITVPVDWLEYLYSRFLFEQGEKEQARFYLQMAVEKGEPIAVQWMNEIDEQKT